MYNDFVLIGPKSDPAGINGGKDIVAALKAVKEKGTGSSHECSKPRPH